MRLGSLDDSAEIAKPFYSYKGLAIVRPA